MRRSGIPTLFLTCAAILLASAPTYAQSSGLGSSSSGLGGGSSGLGSSGLGSSGIGGSSLGGGSSGSSGSFGLGSTGFGTTSTTGSTSAGAGRSSSSQVGATSFEGPYYINPFSLGLATGTTGTSSTTSNFGSPLYNLTSTTGTASINSQANMANSYGAGVNIRRLPSYATTLKFAAPPPPPPAQVRVDLQNMLAQTTQLNPRDSVRIVMDGPAVVLHGRVADDDERRLVENMVLLTPGVNQVRNELAVAGSAP